MDGSFPGGTRPLKIAVVGSGISGLSAAWLLSHRHSVTLYEQDSRFGGHSNTVDVPVGDSRVPVDTGFIVYNPETYPNLVALFDHLNVPTRPSDMSFGVSVGDGAFEYSGSGAAGLLAQKRNAVSPRFWQMVRDIARFSREAPALLDRPEAEDVSLGEYLSANRYSDAFIRDHLLPMGAAIWSTAVDEMRDHPAAAFIRFYRNHGLLKLTGRPQWRTVEGGSRNYVARLLEPLARPLGNGTRAACGVTSIERTPGGVNIHCFNRPMEQFDHVVVAAHADQALAKIDRPTPDERRLLGAIRYTKNRAVLHADTTLMPRRRKVWASWNYLAAGHGRGGRQVCVSYWMNLLQSLPTADPVIVTLNPYRDPRPETVRGEFSYDHPFLDRAAMQAQKELWRLQGVGNIWYCGAWFGAGFHEDGLQAGLAVAETLGGVRRPWTVADESGRIHLSPDEMAAA